MALNPHTACIDIQVSPMFSKSIAKSWIDKVMKQVIEKEYGSKNIELGIVITDDEVMKSLNMKFMGYDETTDVLAFPMEDTLNSEQQGDIQFPAISGQNFQMGEILISYPQAKKQAFYAKTTIKGEILLLLVHGFLHLIGYDHAYPIDKENMWKKQDEIIATIGNY